MHIAGVSRGCCSLLRAACGQGSAALWYPPSTGKPYSGFLKQALASMSAVNITAVNVLDNPTYFTNPMQFEIQYECLHDLRHGARPPFVNNTTPAS